MKQKICFVILFIFGIALFNQNVQAWTTKRLTWNSGESKEPSVVIESTLSIHLFYEDDTCGNYEIFHKKSTNGGSTWATNRLTWNPDGSVNPEAAIDSANNVYVVWMEHSPGNSEIFFKKSTNGGTTWTTKRLTWTPITSQKPGIAIDTNDNIHVVWEEWASTNYEIFYKKSTNGGTTWTTKRLTWNEAGSSYPTIATDSSDYIYVVWSDSRYGETEILCKKSTNGGTSWTTKRLTYTAGFSEPVALTIDMSNNVHVVWEDDTYGNIEILYKKSTNGGLTWSSERLTWSSGNSIWPTIMVNSSMNIHVAWSNNTPGNFELYYKKSTNSGASWTQERLTWNSYHSWYPEIAEDSSHNIYIFWADKSIGGNFEIFFKKGT